MIVFNVPISGHYLLFYFHCKINKVADNALLFKLLLVRTNVVTALDINHKLRDLGC